MPHSHLVTHARKGKINGLRADPTRTTLLRAKWMADMRRRFRRLIAEVWLYMVENDALGLGPRNSLILHAQPQARAFEFHTDAQKLQAFNEWFLAQMEKDILGFIPEPGASWTGPWTTGYVESAYKRGVMNAYMATKSKDSSDPQFLDKSQDQFLRDAFNQPETLSKVQLLGTRAYEQLKGVTSTMGSEMNRILAQGIIDGRGPEAIAREMVDRIAGLSDTRAMLIARTESIYAHAEGQLDSFERLGVKELGIMAEWSTAGDARVCELCADREGELISVAEAHGQIPFHPGCRCSWIPVLSKR